MSDILDPSEDEPDIGKLDIGIKGIARTCHELNREVFDSSQVPWERANNTTKEEMIIKVRHFLDNPEAEVPDLSSLAFKTLVRTLSRYL